MPLRNLWLLDPDEVYAAEELKNHIKDCEIYFPAHDYGIDFLAVRGKKLAGIQVKGSSYYSENTKGPIAKERWHTWHQIKAKKLGREDEVDFYVFVTYIPKLGEHKGDRFETKYLVVRAAEIERRIKEKKPGKNNIYSFYFRLDESNVREIREGRRAVGKNFDYSEFFDNWNQIERFLS